ncbi:MAG: hypothetical protein MUE81_22230 [Thermoflexibacter sp.]|jgi:hypothetical protein|nr:hypothetical protein [Thermoflexibacter sp.]
MEALREKLREFAPLLKADLEEIAQGNFSLEDEKTKPTVSILTFEYFFPQLDISFYATNSEDDQLGYKDLLGGRGILKDLSEHELFVLEKEKNNNTKAYQTIGNEFAHWFATLWESVGGRKLDIPTFLVPNDDTMTMFDLNKGVWLKDESYK